MGPALRVLGVGLALLGLSGAPAAAVTIVVKESILVSVGPGVHPPATVRVQEKVAAIDGPAGLPPSPIDVNESVAIADTPATLAAPVVAVDETVGVSDEPGALPPATVAVVENVGVADAPTGLPAVRVSVSESIALVDDPAGVTSTLIAISETIAVTDDTAARPPASIQVGEAIAVTDVPGALIPLVVAVSETVLVSDGPAALPALAIVVSEVVQVADGALGQPSPDGDGDGVSDASEDAAPNGGDGNDDGTADRLQADVTSLPDGMGVAYVTIVAGGGCTALLDVTSVTEASLPRDADFDYPLGLVDLRLPCSAATLTTLWHGAATLVGPWRQYGPVQPGVPASAAWYGHPSATFDSTLIGGASVARVSLDLADGVLGDDTGTDGEIVATGGPAEAIAQRIPALGRSGAVLYLAALGILLASRFTLVSAQR